MTDRNEEVKKATTLENALKWEASGFSDDACLVALGIDYSHPKAKKLVCLLEDELHGIIQSQRHLRALGMGTAPLNSSPVKVEGRKACSRCGGTGIVAQYRHVNGGACYACGGSGKNSRFH